MRTRTFVVCMSTLIIAGASLFYYQEQDSILVVRAGLTLRVLRKSSEKSGFGWIANRNTNVSLIKWPNMAFESVNIDLTQDYNETRITPVKFTVSF